MTPDVTAIVPTRDRPELLRIALTAIRNQDYEGTIATIVVFDQSEPDTTLVSDDPKRPVRVISNSRAQGLAGGRNTGILAATTELVAFCDDDDSWEIAKIRKQVAFLANNPGIDVVVTGQTIDYGDHQFPRTLDVDRIPLDMLLRKRVQEAHPSSFLIRREALVDRIGLVDEELPGSYAEDYDLLLRAAKLAPIGSVNEPLIRVRWGATSFFFSRWQMIDSALERLIEKHPEFSRSPKGLGRLLGQRAYAAAAAGDRKKALKLAAQTLRRNPLEARAALATAVALKLTTAEKVQKKLHAKGKGI